MAGGLGGVALEGGLADLCQEPRCSHLESLLVDRFVARMEDTAFCAHMQDCTHSRMQECTIASLRAQACAHVHIHAAPHAKAFLAVAMS